MSWDLWEALHDADHHRNRANILETAFRKALADKFWIGAAQHKLTLDADDVTAALNDFVKQATDGWTDKVERYAK